MYFMTIFKQVVEDKVDDPHGRLARLIKYTQGDARERIKSCVYLPKDIGYEKTKALLYEKFGNTYSVLAEFRKQLLLWPKLKPNDATSFSQFYNFLLKFEAALETVNKSTNPELLQTLITKLPTYLQDRWNRIAFKLRRDTQKEQTLATFIKLIDEEACLASDPLYSRDAISDFSHNRKSFEEQRKDDKTTTTRLKNFFVEQQELQSQCLACQKPYHDLENCKRFLSWSSNDRRKFIFHKRLCFCCLKPTSLSHSAKNCKAKRICKICNQSHPTTLHEYETTKKVVDQPIESLSTKSEARPESSDKKQTVFSTCLPDSDVISLCVVPVKVSHPTNPGKTIEVFALLDNGSQGTFLHEDLIEELHLPGVQTSLVVKTLSGEEVSRCTAVDGLHVSSLLEGSPVVKLPRCYSRTSLPVEIDEIPTTDKALHWSHLKKIHHLLVKDAQSLPIGLLIGGNCPVALQPLEKIPSQNNGPYAYRSALGWCVSGPITARTRTDGIMSSCNQIAVRRPHDNSYHFFNFKENIKDTSIREMLLAMYETDFHEATPHPIVEGFPKISVEDQRFLDLMDKEAKQIEGHYTLPLPLRDPNKVVPNNRHLAVQRAK